MARLKSTLVPARTSCTGDTTKTGPDLRSQVGLTRREIGAVLGWGAASSLGCGSPGAIALEASLKPAFPVRPAHAARHLVDAEERPFLLAGDAAWSLIADLPLADAHFYLESRARAGFNAVLVSLLERKFARNAPANAAGAPPFRVEGDYSTPNEAYFAHADMVLDAAESNGLLVMLAPSYAGANGGAEGWYELMVVNGEEKLRRYGSWLGARLRKRANIIYVQAGDYNPPRRDLVRAIVDGVREADPRSLHMVHSAPEANSSDDWSGEPWITVDTVYTYRPVYKAARRAYLRPERRPFILFETAYENEHGADALRTRTQAWQAILSGAAGQIFGNNPMWHFDGPGLFPAPGDWRRALTSPGTAGVTHLMAALSRLPWWTLRPDVENRLLISGHGTGHARAVAARSEDRTLAICYIPSRRTLLVDCDELAAWPQARWFDPARGRWHDDPARPSGRWRVTTPEPNTPDSGDWVLVLRTD